LFGRGFESLHLHDQIESAKTDSNQKKTPSSLERLFL